MSGTGIGQNVYLFGGADGRAAGVSEGGGIFVQGTLGKIKNIGRMVLRDTTPTRLRDLPTSWVMITAKEGNGANVWWAGYDSDVPAVGVGTPLIEGRSIVIPATNANQISLIAENDGDEIYVTAGLAGEDVTLTPGNPDPLDVVPPTILSIVPASGATNIERSTIITITASEILDSNTVDSTTVTLKTTAGAVTVAATTSLDSADLSKIVITPTSQLAASTSFTVTVTTSVADPTGNTLAAPFTSTFTTKAAAPPPDTTAPTIVSTSPANNATSVATAVSPTITFSEAMLSSSISTSTIKILKTSNSQEVSGLTYSLSTDNKTVTITLGALTASTSYTLRVIGGSSGVKDLAGNALAATQNFAFSTAAAALETVYSVTGNAYDELNSGGYTETAIKVVNSSSRLYNRKPKKYTIVLKKSGSGTSGNATLVWIRSSSVLRTISTIATSSIGTSDTTFNIDDSTNTTAIASSDRIGVRYSGGGTVYVKISNYNAFDGRNTILSRTLIGFPFDAEDRDLAGTIQCE